MPPPPLRVLPDTGIFIHYARQSDLGKFVEATYALSTASPIPIISTVTVGELRFISIQGHCETGREARKDEY